MSIKRSRCLAALLLVMFSIAPVYADDTEGISLISWLQGSWNITSETWNRATESWMPGGSSKADIEPVLAGVALQEKVYFELGGGNRIDMLNLYSFDTERGVFRCAMLDQQSGLLDLYTGLMDDESLVLENFDSGTPYPMPNGDELYFRLTYTPVSETEFTLFVEATTDDGDTWVPYVRARYSRSTE